MPLASIVQVPFIWLLGPTGFASALPFALHRRARGPADLGDRPRRGCAERRSRSAPASSSRSRGLMTIFMAQPDNFALYQPLVAGALWLAARGLKGHPRSFALGGLLVGLATLSRNDGVLVGAVARARRSSGTAGARGAPTALDRHGIPWSGGDRLRRAVLPRHGAVVDPPARGVRLDLAVDRVGQGPLHPRRSRSGTRSRRRRRSTTSSAMGLGPLLDDADRGAGRRRSSSSRRSSRPVILLPFMIIGGWARRRSVDFGPCFVYAAILFAFSAIVSAVHVPGGTFIHSAIALAPHAYILAVEGIAVAVAWIAARRPRWNRDAATRLFTVFIRRDRRPRRDPGRDQHVPDVGRRPRRPQGRRRGARPRRRGPRRPDHVDRRRGLQVLDGPRRRRQPRTTRSTRSARSPRPTRSSGSSSSRTTPSAPSSRSWPAPGRRGSGRRSSRSRARTAKPAEIVYPVCVSPQDERCATVASAGLPHDAVASRRACQALLVFAVALLVRILAASIVVFPQPEDTAYYVGVARNLLDGHGLVSDAIWSFQTPPLSFPRPAFEVWLPLPTFLAAIPMAILGPTFAAAQWASVVVGAVVPVLAWRIGGRRRRSSAACR